MQILEELWKNDLQIDAGSVDAYRPAFTLFSVSNPRAVQRMEHPVRARSAVHDRDLRPDERSGRADAGQPDARRGRRHALLSRLRHSRHRHAGQPLRIYDCQTGGERGTSVGQARCPVRVVRGDQLGFRFPWPSQPRQLAGCLGNHHPGAPPVMDEHGRRGEAGLSCRYRRPQSLVSGVPAGGKPFRPGEHCHDPGSCGGCHRPGPPGRKLLAAIGAGRPDRSEPETAGNTVQGGDRRIVVPFLGL